MGTYSGKVYLSTLAVGDFDGDGADDLLKTTGSHWYVSWGGSTNFEYRKKSSYRVSQIKLADFDGNGTTDVFANNASSKKSWDISYGASSRWTKINSSSYKTHQIKLGDFNGDGRADVLRR